MLHLCCVFSFLQAFLGLLRPNFTEFSTARVDFSARALAFRNLLRLTGALI